MTESEISARLKLTAAAHERLAATGVAAIIAAGDAMKTALGGGRSILVFGKAQEVHTTVLHLWCELIDGEG